MRGGIFHVSVVTAVTKDAGGTETRYTLFHGRSTGKTAGRTAYHNVRGPSNLGDPILGVGTEKWVASVICLPRKNEGAHRRANA